MRGNIRKWKNFMIPVELLIIGILGYFLGFFNFVFELNTPIGKFVRIVRPDGTTNIIDDSKLNLSAYDLAQEFKGMTNYEIDVRSKKYNGRRVEDIGYVIQVINNESSLLVSIGKTLNSYNPSIFCFFENDWRDKLLVLKIGEKIKFSGLIKHIPNSISIDLEKCQLR